MNTNFDQEGLTNLAVGMIRQTRKDYVKGMVIISKELNCSIDSVLDDEEIMSICHKKSANRPEYNHFLSAVKFVKKDPYELFSPLSPEQVYNTWNKDAKLVATGKRSLTELLNAY